MRCVRFSGAYLADVDVGSPEATEDEIDFGWDAVCLWRGVPNLLRRRVIQRRFQESAEPPAAKRRAMLSRAAKFPLFGTNPPARNFVTVQVPQSIFLDKSRGIGYRRVDECESGSPDKATRGSGE